MDFGTLVGIVLGFGLIIASILMGGDLASFINAPGLAIVVGGTVAATLIGVRLKVALRAVKVAMNAFVDRAPVVQETATTIQNLSGKVRKEGLLALEGEQIDDAFLGKAVRLAVDGVPIEVLRATLGSEVHSLLERHQTGQKVFRFMGSTAPGMGMVGTLIGLVQMLKTLDDPSAIGPAMAVALLTTLYGAVLAFLIFNPIADKLSTRTDVEATNMRLVIEGIASVVSGENAALIQEKLNSFLEPGQRNEESSQAA